MLRLQYLFQEQEYRFKAGITQLLQRRDEQFDGRLAEVNGQLLQLRDEQLDGRLAEVNGQLLQLRDKQWEGRLAEVTESVPELKQVAEKFDRLAGAVENAMAKRDEIASTIADGFSRQSDKLETHLKDTTAKFEQIATENTSWATSNAAFLSMIDLHKIATQDTFEKIETKLDRIVSSQTAAKADFQNTENAISGKIRDLTTRIENVGQLDQPQNADAKCCEELSRQLDEKFTQFDDKLKDHSAVLFQCMQDNIQVVSEKLETLLMTYEENSSQHSAYSADGGDGDVEQKKGHVGQQVSRINNLTNKASSDVNMTPSPPPPPPSSSPPPGSAPPSSSPSGSAPTPPSPAFDSSEHAEQDRFRKILRTWWDETTAGSAVQESFLSIEKMQTELAAIKKAVVAGETQSAVDLKELAASVEDLTEENKKTTTAIQTELLPALDAKVRQASTSTIDRMRDEFAGMKTAMETGNTRSANIFNELIASVHDSSDSNKKTANDLRAEISSALDTKQAWTEAHFATALQEAVEQIDKKTNARIDELANVIARSQNGIDDSLREYSSNTATRVEAAVKSEVAVLLRELRDEIKQTMQEDRTSIRKMAERISEIDENLRTNVDVIRILNSAIPDASSLSQPRLRAGGKRSYF
ncbi:hypothetical protein CYMTET_7219 [Cymbomonas tetramitiformis]|uniref:Uncharacterized protein n=1 Tax=Cymbomonas tetramitiformis TaxID=36881 RepID=A0AAE0GVX8_9CHLO|nr:hypothetical protein CYMTET_49159 [Cymbomonas tetramitiformis]KAK3285163.1 hypothetical protein CYMTET_7219 [Cymbomonas tetramitiformis]